MKYIVVLLLLLLQACQSTVSVKIPFPSVPDKLLVECPPLATLDTGNTKLSELMLVVSKNYAEYHKCSAKMQAWIGWYHDNSKLNQDINVPKSNK
ncbi:hypothetical protein UFOVP116_375 [uncultured Caudovirales phage]|uniref:Uncharacterized protein n=1 Tax=uncultured Caudovirales phage TaxID=2100421 RepID=A0A6J5L7D1_9CAUD|nr:hypothetical protein UFOVP116_375 [uncultured Caudovirales phage]